METTFTEIEELRHLSPQKFILVVAEHYGMSADALSDFFDDYDIQPKGGWGFDDNEPL